MVELVTKMLESTSDPRVRNGFREEPDRVLRGGKMTDKFHGFNTISETQREAAIQYLMKTVPADRWPVVLDVMKKEPEEWPAVMHWDFGLYIRNLLFDGNIDRGSVHPDSLWSDLVGEIVFRKFNYPVATGIRDFTIEEQPGPDKSLTGNKAQRDDGRGNGDC